MEKRVEIVNRATKGVTTSVANTGETRIVVPSNTDIKIVAPREAIGSMLREGDDLILKFSDGSSIRLDGYFACPADESANITLEDPTSGAGYMVDLGDPSCFAAGDPSSELVTYELTPLGSDAVAVAAGGAMSTGLLIALGGLGLAGGALALGGGGGGGGDDNVTPPPGDTTPPLAPVVTPSNGRTISGTAEAGSTVRVDINGDGSVEGSVTADANGNFSYTPTAPIGNGVTVAVTATDAAGNTSPATRIVVDAAAPATPTINPSDGTSLTGMAEAGSTVLIDLNRDGTPDATVIAGPDGRYTYTPPTPLADGTTVTVTARDPVGNVSNPATLTLDLSAPAAPVVTAAIDNVDPVQGAIANGASTNDTTPSFSGTAEAGATITVSDNGIPIGTTIATNGSWTFTPAPPLGEGAHSVTVTATDATGNRGPASTPFTFTVDTSAPAAPQLAPTNGVTASGTAEAGSTIGVDTTGDGVPDVTTTTDATGTWSVVLPTPLPTGAVVTAVATDAAGNVSPSGSVTVTNGVDVIAPSAPVVGLVTDDVAPVVGPIANGAVTNDAAPSFAGTSEPGAVVTVFDGTTQIGTVTVDGTGSFVFTPAAPLAEGSHSVTFVATDAAGNVSAPTAPFALTVDTLAPATPTVAPSNGTVLTGTAEAGSTVVVDLGNDGTPDGTTQADGAGNWSFTPSTPIPDGTTVGVTSADAAGNTSPPALVVVDSVAPVAPVITGATDDQPGIVGVVPAGGLSNDPTLTLAGTAEANATVSVFDGTVLIGTVVADVAGAWTLITPALGEGAHSFTAAATDATGNVGAASAAYAVTIDTTAPAAPVLNASDGTTLSGTAEAGATVLVDTTGDGTPDATTTADAGGAWSVTFAPALADDTVIAVVQVDAAGNASPSASVTVDIAVDTTPPAVPTITSVSDDVAPIQGPLTSGAATNDATPTLAGTAEAGVLVSIYDNGVLLGTTSADGTGSWTFTPTVPLAEGTHGLTATTTDTAGNQSAASPAFALTVDTLAPAAPTVAPSNGTVLTGTAEAGSTVVVDLGNDGTRDGTTQADGAGNWSLTPGTPIADGTTVGVTAADAAGNTSPPALVVVDSVAPVAPVVTSATDDQPGIVGVVPAGGLSNDPTLALAGTAEANATVSVFDGSTLIGTVVADAAGAWTLTTPALAEGAHSFTAVATDATGNVGAASAAYAVTIDTTAPAAPVLNASDGTTLSGTAEAGATVLVDTTGDGTPDATTTADAGGAWSVTFAPALADDTVIGVVQVDAAGNASPSASVTVDIAVDTTPPAVPTITSVSDDVAPNQGPLASGAATNDATPTLAGTAEAGVLVSIYDNGVLLGTTSADGTGSWTFTPTGPLAEGTHGLTATTTDTAGNQSAASPAFALTVDTLAPATPTVAPSNGTVLTGTAESGSTVVIDLGNDGTPDGTTQADGAGNWTFTPATAIPDGTTVGVTAADAAGNTSPPAIVVVDSVAPVAPVITSATDDQPGIVGVVAAGGLSNDPTLALVGTAEANATVSVFDGSALIGTVVADAAGAWTLSTPALGEGAHSFTAVATDATGNVGPASAAYAVTLDTTAPAAPVLNASDGTTLSGTAEAGAAVLVDTTGDGTPDATTIADAGGAWSVTFAPALADDTVIGVVQVDAAGNASPSASVTVDIAVDTTPPAVPAITSVSDDVAPIQGPLTSGAATNDATPTLAGTAEAGVLVSIYDNGVLLGTTNADGAGSWTFTPAGPLAEGTHGLTATTTDTAGNQSAASPAFALTVDTLAPAAPDIAPSSGAVLTGTAEANATINLDLDGNGTFDATTTADGTGAWSFTPASQLADGATVIATATDAAGNTSGPDSTTIDRIAPAAPAVTGVLDDVGAQVGNVPNGGTTDDVLPVITGAAEAGATVTVFDNGAPIGQVTAAADGSWSLPLTTPLAAGPHAFVAAATDAAGNISPASAAYTVAVDTSTPVEPVITTFTDDVGALQGTIPSGGASDDALPVIGGTGPANATITVFDGATSLGTTTSDGTGAWSFAPTTALPDGSHKFTATATNAAGTVSPVSNSYGITIDTGVPLAPTIGSVTDDAPQIVGPVALGGLTNDATPTLSGTAEAGSNVSIFNNGVLLATVAADGSGNWTVTPTLADGPQSITVTAVDLAGNTSPASAAFTFTVDATAPAAPLVNPTNGAGSLSGTAEPNATVNIDIGNDGGPVSVTASPTGTWTYAYPANQGDGTPIAVTATDPAGNTSPATLVIVDQIAPIQPTLTAVTDDQAPVIGNIAAGGATNDTQPALTGTAEANSTVTILDNNVVIGTVSADGLGAWSFTPTVALADGPHSITVTATDAASNVSPATAPFAFTVITAAPAVPAINTVTDDTTPQTGVVVTGGSTNDTIPLVQGIAEAGAVVTLFIDGVAQPGTVTADAGGAFAFSPTLAEGPHTFAVTATNAAGLTSGQSPTYAIVVDTTPPAVPILNPSDGTTVAGTGEPGATIQVFVSGNPTPATTTTVNGLGQWTSTLTPPVADGTVVTAVAVDAAGNVSGPGTVTTDTGVNTTPPAIPIVTAVADDGPTPGPVVNGSATNDGTPVISGTSDANVLITIFDGAAVIGSVTASPTGTWSFTSPLLSEGAHSISATATAGGLQSINSAPATFTVDLTAPAVPTIAPSNGTTLTGTAEANAAVLLDTNNDGVVDATVQANASGAWTFTPGVPLADLTVVSATAQDAAGNVSAPGSQTIDRAAPVAPAITGAADDVGPVQGNVASGGATDDTSPALSGTAEANSTIAIFDGATQLGTATTNGAGVWTFTPPTALATGAHSFTVTATDAVGNVSAASPAYTLTVITTAPVAPVITTATDDVGTVVGPIASGGVTDDMQPAISGTAAANVSVSIFEGATLLGTTTSDGAGNWTITPTVALASGLHTVTAVATNAAGLVSPASNAYDITVDVTAPAAPVITSIVDDVAPGLGVIADGGISNDATPQLTGTAVASTTLLIYDNGILLGSTTSDGAGAWTFTPGTAIANGAHSFSAVAVDPAGNASAASNAYGLVVDTIAPTQTVAITTLTTDTGVLGDWSTQDTTPIVGGTLSAALGAGEQVQVQIDGGTWVNATTSGTTWFYGAGTLAVGAHLVGARVVDTAGNVGSSTTQPLAITAIANQAPIVQANGTSLLGLVGVEALNLIDIGSQSVSAVDPNNNLRSVQVRYAPLLGAGLSAYTLTASTALAAELGLQITIVNNPGILLVLAPSSTLTITAIGGGAADNLAVNELLNTVHFEQTLPVLSLDILSATSITATDTNNLTSTAATGNLANVGLLNVNGSPNLFEGGVGNDAVNGGVGNDRLYGYAGADTLHGGNGNDFLRGGAGADTLFGDAGNDTLVYDAADVRIDGGTGIDTLFVDAATTQVINLDAITNLHSIERIDLGTGDAGHQLVVTEAGVIRATDAGSPSLTIDGDASDTVTLTGATLQGQTLINGEAYNHYVLGSADIYVDHAVLAVV